MNNWRWEHQGDGRVLRLFQGDRNVLVIDKTKLRIQDETGVKRYDEIIGQGSTPTFEDEKLILGVLNNETTINKIFSEILKERKHQNEAWGSDKDDENTVNDWVVFINRYATYVAEDCNASREARRKSLVKVAAIAVAAIEAFDRNQGFPLRHYDET